jgi:mono/diheme cytochrome c family protein
MPSTRTRWPIGLVRAVVAAVALAGAGASALAQAPVAAQQNVPPGNAQAGKDVFNEYYCYACHGTMGQGGSAGARIAPRPIAFEAFLRYIRNPSGGMPAYTTKVISVQQLTDVYAFLRSVPAPRAAKSIALLNE